MIRRVVDRWVDVVTTHDRVVVLLALVLTAGMVVGVASAEMSGESGFGGAVDTTVDEKEQYVQQQYGAEGGDGGDAEAAVQFPVYVRAPDGNALSKGALLATLEFQRTAAAEEPVAAARTDDEVQSVASLVGARAAGDPAASIEDRIAALEAADAAEVAALVRTTIEEESRAQLLLPDSYEPGTATAESTQVVLSFEPDDGGQPPVRAQEAIHDAAESHGDGEALELFTLGAAATDEQVATQLENTIFLVLPLVVALIVGAAAFAYRDVVDVFVGITGVVVSIVWMFGLLGWLGVDVGPAVVIGPVLIAGLSIDYGFHVFMRYREQRGDDAPIRPPMARGLRSVAVAFGLVTLTAGIGFLSNLANPVGALRDLGIAIALGVASAFVVFVTLVPALKIALDTTLERLGVDRRTRPLGSGGYLRPLLASTVTLARRAAPVVLVVALLLTAGGAIAWTGLEEETMESPDGDVAEWKQELPGPVGWEDNEVIEDRQYVGEQFRTASAEDGDRVQVLVEGDVTADGTLQAVERGIAAGVERGAFSEGRTDTIQSPATVIRDVAAEDAAFAATVDAADADGDGVPETQLETVYDHLYEVASDRASAVIERVDGSGGTDDARSASERAVDHEYRSLRVVGPPQAADAQQTSGDRAGDLFAVGDAIEADGERLTATVVSDATSERAAIERITDGIVRVMVLAVIAVFLALVATYRWVHGSATLGAVTAAPIASVLAFVAGGMYLLGVPLTFLTALLVSLVIGVGVDYTVHVSDRFADELERGQSVVEALETAVTGTGGALLGSALTSVAAFAGMLVHPNPGFENFATLVVLALVAAFLTSVVVLPSLLYVWGRRVATASPQPAPRRADAAPAQD